LFSISFNMKSKTFLEFCFLETKWFFIASNSNLFPLNNYASILTTYLLFFIKSSFTPDLAHGGKYKLQKLVVHMTQYWWREGSYLFAISFAQVWHCTWSWEAEHLNPFLSCMHYLHFLPELSSSEAERSEPVLTRPLPLDFLAPLDEGGSITAFVLAATFLPWILYLISIGSCPKIFLFLAYYSSLSLLFYSGWDFR